MPKSTHANARTSATVRKAIRQSPDSLRVLAERYGINPKTVAKWKSRARPDDLPSGPKSGSSAALTGEEEEIVVAFRQKTHLPLDDCLYALQARIPGLSRSTLHRCFVRHGISRLPSDARPKPGEGPAASPSVGCFDIDVTTATTADGPVEVMIAMDHGSKFVFLEVAARRDDKAVASFLRKLAGSAPLAVSRVRFPAQAPFVTKAGRPRFTALCVRLGIESRLRRPPAPGTFAELDWPGHDAISADGRPVFEAGLHAFVHAYNFRRRLKALRGLTPFEFHCASMTRDCSTRL